MFGVPCRSHSHPPRPRYSQDRNEPYVTLGTLASAAEYLRSWTSQAWVYRRASPRGMHTIVERLYLAIKSPAALLPANERLVLKPAKVLGVICTSGFG
jgi:hypothetical protein